jgi:hypothetical protein
MEANQPRARLTPAQVRWVRSFAHGLKFHRPSFRAFACREVAAALSVHPTTIRAIWSRKSWRQVTTRQQPSIDDTLHDWSTLLQQPVVDDPFADDYYYRPDDETAGMGHTIPHTVWSL